MRASPELRFADRFPSFLELHRHGWDGVLLVLPAVSCRPPKRALQLPPAAAVSQLPAQDVAPHSWRPLPLAASFQLKWRDVPPHSSRRRLAGACSQLPAQDAPPRSWRPCLHDSSSRQPLFGKPLPAASFLVPDVLLPWQPLPPAAFFQLHE